MLATHEYSPLTLVQLRAVATVARLRSFTASASALATSQSAVSRAVADAEAVLGAALFDRTTRRVIATAAGEELAARAERILAEVDAAVAAVHAVGRGDAAPAHLAVACLMSVAHAHLAAALTEFDAPARGVRVTCLEAMQAAVLDEVTTGRVHVGIADVGELPPGLAARALWDERFHACLPSAHPLAGRPSLSLAELGGDDVIAFPREARIRHDTDRGLARAGQLRAPRLVVQQYATAFRLIAEGFGVAVVPASATIAAPAGLAFPLLSDAGLQRRVGAVWLPGSPPPPAADAFVHIVAVLATTHARPHRGPGSQRDT
jgi:DNA-binding transcriptional LysR family regulator